MHSSWDIIDFPGCDSVAFLLPLLQTSAQVKRNQKQMRHALLRQLQYHRERERERDRERREIGERERRERERERERER